jgi:SOS-response transcriptional repressor LexA
MVQLTERQQEIFSFIKSKIELRGYGPTVREIGQAFDIRSPFGVKCHLKVLERNGFVKRETFSTRAIQLLEQTESAPDNRIAEENKMLQEQVQQLQAQVYELKKNAEVREGFIRDLQDQKRCADCQRSRNEW